MSNLVKQQSATDKRKWVVIAECFFPCHAKQVFEDCKWRWPERKFRMIKNGREVI